MNLAKNTANKEYSALKGFLIAKRGVDLVFKKNALDRIPLYKRTTVKEECQYFTSALKSIQIFKLN